MARHRSGFTLLELLVVMGVFALVLTVALGFYGWGIHTSQYQTRRMDAYRHTLEAIDRVFNALTEATVLYVTPTEIVFAPHAPTAPLDRVAWRWPAQAVTVAVQGQNLVWSTAEKRDTILVMAPTQTLQFAAVPAAGNAYGGSAWRPVYESLEVDTKATTSAVANSGTTPPFNLQRSLLLRTPY